MSNEVLRNGVREHQFRSNNTEFRDQSFEQSRWPFVLEQIVDDRDPTFRRIEGTSLNTSLDHIQRLSNYKERDKSIAFRILILSTYR